MRLHPAILACAGFSRCSWLLTRTPAICYAARSSLNLRRTRGLLPAPRRKHGWRHAAGCGRASVVSGCAAGHDQRPESWPEKKNGEAHAPRTGQAPRKRNKEPSADDIAGPRMQLPHIALAARISHRETCRRRIPDNQRIDPHVGAGDHGLFPDSPALRSLMWIRARQSSRCGIIHLGL